MQPNNKGALQALTLGRILSGLWGGPAFYQGPEGPTVYVQIQDDVLRSFSVSTGARPALTLAKKGTTSAGYGGSLPIVTSNGSAANTGVVWLLRRSAPIELEAYDAVTIGAPIYAASVGDWSNPPYGNSFLTPIEANGRVYVTAYRTVKVFGLAK
jgi:hypothetical protein